jgi:O-antigen/teichoic acid export membrane protein
MGPQFWKIIKTNSIWKGAQLGSLFLLNLAIARVFEAGWSGNFLFLVTNFQLLITLFSFSIDSAIQYYTAANPEWISSLKRFIFQYCIICVLVLAFLAGIGDFFHWWKLWDPRISLVLCTTSYIGGTLFVKFIASMGIGLKSVKPPMVLDLLGNVSLLILLAFIYYERPDWGAKVFTDAYCLMPGILGVILYFYLKGVYSKNFTGSWLLRLSPSETRLHFPSLLKYSGFSFGANLVFFLVYRMDYWWVAAFCTDKELGNYVQASKLVQLFYYFPQLVASIIFAEVVQGGSIAAPAMIRRLLTYIWLIFGGCIVLFLLFGHWLLGWVLGPSFEQVYPTFCWLIPGIFSLGGLAIVSAYFAGINRVPVNLQGALIGLVVMSLGDWILIPRFHIIGAAFVSSLAYTTLFLYGWIRFVQQERVTSPTRA